VGGTNSDSDWLGHTDNDATLIRLNPNGSLDNSFDHDGKASFGFGWNENAKTMAIDYSGTATTNPNFGRIYLAGDQYAEGNRTHFVTRINANGSLDRTYNQAHGFAGQGATLFSFSTASSNLNGMTIQRDGKPVLVGVTGDPHIYGAQQFAITRLGTDGWFDPTFNGGHAVLTGFGGDDVANSVVQSATGSLVVAGTVNGALALASYTSAGQLNTKFGIGGRVKADFDATLNYSGYAGLARTADNKLVIAGGRSFRTARLGDNALPIRPLFGDLGRLTRSVRPSMFSESPIDRLIA
jgi:uncharacterized delta-60 repeat protein